MTEEDQLSRRSFLSIATWAIGGFMGIVLAIPALAYIIGPSLQRTKSENWVRLGSTSKVEIGNPSLFKTVVENQTGWIVSEAEISAYVITENGRDFSALSNICTHLGCRVRWIPESEQFFCPCHNGVFDSQGLVISGPPPRPLDRYETRVENDQLFILVGG
ncbi:MAG TPA: ubiquinol-cytochrome c reductase iron-sulfur subunit [Anaerolineales bacterium]|jgi:menaquinol-cytochrome c reductase iron-sulfur subunit|nr:ubiquinol-cytochrome c reductase iron-sulfur subunit [Anaerolineales bacterium]